MHMKHEKLGAAFSQSRHNDFWKVVHNISKSNKGSASIIDGYSGNDNIANAFSSKLQGLLNSDNSLNSDLTSKIESSLSSSDLVSTLVSSGTVSEALSHLKSDKSDGTQLKSNHFILPSSSLASPLSKLFYSHVTPWLCP